MSHFRTNCIDSFLFWQCSKGMLQSRIALVSIFSFLRHFGSDLHFTQVAAIHSMEKRPGGSGYPKLLAPSGFWSTFPLLALTPHDFLCTQLTPEAKPSCQPPPQLFQGECHRQRLAVPRIMRVSVANSEGQRHGYCPADFSSAWVDVDAAEIGMAWPPRLPKRESAGPSSWHVPFPSIMRLLPRQACLLQACLLLQFSADA